MTGAVQHLVFMRAFVNNIPCHIVHSRMVRVAPCVNKKTFDILKVFGGIHIWIGVVCVIL